MANLDRKMQIVSFLNHQTGWTTTTMIAQRFSFSVRSVKYSVAELNKEYGALILSSNKGYKIDKLAAAKILSFLPSQTIPASYEERKRYIINKLLLQNQRMSISDLSDKLCISPITLQNELSRMRTDLTGQGQTGGNPEPDQRGNQKFLFQSGTDSGNFHVGQSGADQAADLTGHAQV